MATERPPETLDVPPFPPLTWDGYFWAGADRFVEWASFQDRTGAEGMPDQPRRPTSVTVHPADRALRTPPTAEQAAAYAHLKAHGPAVVAAILDAVLAAYPALRESYRDAIDDFDEVMPEVTDPADFRRLIGLGTVHVLNVARDGVAYVGFEIGCAWDEEHGVGVMTHRGRVVGVGGADESFSEWGARHDGGEPLGTAR